MKPSTLNRFANEVVTIMPLVIREFVKREDNELTRGRISFPQMVTLHYVLGHARVTMTEIANVLSIQMSSATVLVDRLVRDKMLLRSRDEEDRRIVWVSAAPRARQVMKRIMSQKRESVKAIFAVLSERERDQYLLILRKVRSHLAVKA